MDFDGKSQMITDYNFRGLDLINGEMKAFQPLEFPDIPVEIAKELLVLQIKTGYLVIIPIKLEDIISMVGLIRDSNRIQISIYLKPFIRVDQIIQIHRVLFGLMELRVLTDVEERKDPITGTLFQEDFPSEHGVLYLKLEMPGY